MLVQRAYKTELDLNDRQVTACKQHAGAPAGPITGGCGSSRNGIEPPEEPHAIALHRELNALKKTQIPWMYSVSKCAPQEALWNLDAAFQHFFRRWRSRSKASGGTLGYPQFKTRRRGWAVPAHRPIVVSRRRSCCRGWGAAPQRAGYLPTAGVQILSATVSEQAGHWYVSVQVEESAVPEIPAVVGIDLGIKHSATLSDGEVIPNPRHLNDA